MKEYACGSLVPGCAWRTRHQDEAEVVRRATEHMRTAHDETDIRPEMVERIKQRITTEGEAA